MMSKNTLLYIGGPTASGKTKIAVKLAKYFKTEIISCDSRQFYKEMSIGTSVPTIKERGGITHHLIQHKSIFETYNAWDFAEDANILLKRLFKNKSLVIMVGGSGLYAKSVISGLDYFPKVSVKIRNEIEKIYQEDGIESLKEMLSIADPIYFKKVDQKNHRRLIRALEIYRTTMKPYSSFLNKKDEKKSFETKTIVIDIPRRILHNRIKSRVNTMFDNGLEKEAIKLHQHKKNNAMQTIGYKEWFDFIDKKINREQVKSEIIKNTNRYAKKQLTWFKKNFQDDFIAEEKIDSFLCNLF